MTSATLHFGPVSAERDSLVIVARNQSAGMDGAPAALARDPARMEAEGGKAVTGHAPSVAPEVGLPSTNVLVAGRDTSDLGLFVGAVRQESLLLPTTEGFRVRLLPDAAAAAMSKRAALLISGGSQRPNSGPDLIECRLDAELQWRGRMQSTSVHLRSASFDSLARGSAQADGTAAGVADAIVLCIEIDDLHDDGRQYDSLTDGIDALIASSSVVLPGESWRPWRPRLPSRRRLAARRVVVVLTGAESLAEKLGRADAVEPRGPRGLVAELRGLSARGRFDRLDPLAQALDTLGPPILNRVLDAVDENAELTVAYAATRGFDSRTGQVFGRASNGTELGRDAPLALRTWAPRGLVDVLMYASMGVRSPRLFAIEREMVLDYERERAR